MKTLLHRWVIVFFILLSTLKSAAQTSVYHPFPTDSAMWSYQAQSWAASCVETYGYKANGDTLLNNQSYVKIYKVFSFTNDSNSSLHCFLRVNNDSHKVWMKYANPALFIDTSEFLLYDFNLKLNDFFYARRLKLDSNSFRTDTFQVISVDSVSSLRGYLPRIKLQLKNTTDIYTFVEKIGSDLLFIYPEKPYLICGESPDFTLSLSCFREKQQNYFQQSNCFIYYHPNSIEESAINKMGFTIYPNPNCGHQLSLLNPNRANWSKYSISEINGAIQLQGQLSSGTNEQIIELSDSLSKGIYFLRIESENNLPVCIKLIII